MKWIGEIMNSFKDKFGLADYKIFINSNKFTSDGTIAKMDFNWFEKELVLQLSEDFFELPEEKQYNVLIHELLHARVGLLEFVKSRLTADLEEQFVNDVVRGIEAIKPYHEFSKEIKLDEK